MTSKGWYEARFRCKKLQAGSWEREVLRACFHITGSNGRLFADWDDKDNLGHASRMQIADFMNKKHTDENLKKISLVLKFLRFNTWVKLHFVARDGKRNGATRILVSKACYMLSKPVSEFVKKFAADNKSHIWGSGFDFDFKTKTIVNKFAGLRDAALALGMDGPMVRRLG